MNAPKILFGMLLGMIGSVQAEIVAVYSAPGTSCSEMESLKAFALQAREELSELPEGSQTVLWKTPQNDTLIARYAVTRNRDITADLSVAEGEVAYFYALGPLTSQEGFVVNGECTRTDDGTLEESALASPVAVEPSQAGAAGVTALQSAFWKKGQLVLRYTLAAPGRVTATVRNLNGQVLGTWVWEDSGEGVRERTLSLKNGTSGAMLVHWTSGNLQLTQKIR